MYRLGQKRIMICYIALRDATAFTPVMTYTFFFQRSLSVIITGRVTSSLRMSRAIHCVIPIRDISTQSGQDHSYMLIMLEICFDPNIQVVFERF